MIKGRKSIKSSRFTLRGNRRGRGGKEGKSVTILTINSVFSSRVINISPPRGRRSIRNIIRGDIIYRRKSKTGGTGEGRGGW